MNRSRDSLVPPWPVATAVAGMLAAGGLFAVGYRAAEQDVAEGRVLIWIALIATALCFGFAVQSSGLRVRWALLAVAVLAAVLYLPKLFRTPEAFIFFDELQHVRSTEEYASGAGLFADNPLNPLLEHYPVLHLLTAGLAKLTGLSVFTAGNLLLVVARILMLVSLFFLYRRLLDNTRLAALGTLVYAANPAYLFFDAQFSYESLSLPLGTAALALAVAGRGPLWRFWLPVALLLAMVGTHHASAYAMAALFLLLGTCTEILEPDEQARALRLVTLGTITVIASVAWFLYVATDTGDYLGGGLSETLKSIPDFLAGGESARAPFGGSHFQVPTYERVASVVGIALLGLAFAYGLLLAWRDSERRGRYLAFALLGALYFVSLPLQLLQDASAIPIAQRIWEVSFIGLSPIAALGLARLGRSRRRFAAGAAAAAAISVIVVGGAIVRSGENIRLPGPYVASAGPVAETPDVIAAARWFERRYGPHRTVMGDISVVNGFGAYARARPASYQNDGFYPWRVFYSDRLTGAGSGELERSATEFVVVDRRVTRSRPFGGFYFSPEEPDLDTPTMPERYLRKFDREPFFERVFDNGNIRIYRYLKNPISGSGA